MSRVLRICLATHNAHKVGELVALLASCAPAAAGRVELVSLAELGVSDEAVEDGETFAENAQKKAAFAHARTGMWSLADDSGLAVDALNGAPGIRSARFGGEPRSDARNITALLTALQGVPDERRTARFVCALCLYGRAPGDAAPTVYTSQGVCTGRLLRAVSGAGGFGYDPLFVPDAAQWPQPDAPRDQTFGELPAAQKNLISHRTAALRALAPDLIRISS